MAAPEFPPPYIVERTRSLGFGTGPWRREQLVQLWDAPMTDKYIGEAKAAGWLVSPSRGVYFVPPVQDLLVVSWLPEPVRSEFLISRTLATAGLRYWCLSAWCRDRGLNLSAPVFVTDLGEMSSKPTPATLDRRNLRDELARRAAGRQTLPFLENLLVVPALPALGPPTWRTARVTETPQAEARRQTTQIVGQAAVGLIGLVLWAATKEPPDSSADLNRLRKFDDEARGVPYAVGPEASDEAWIVALLAALGTGRIEKIVADEARRLPAARRGDVLRWAGLLGPPEPVASWKETIAQGTFPFLLVPPQLWTDMGADQAARRFRMLDQLGGERR